MLVELGGWGVVGPDASFKGKLNKYKYKHLCDSQLVPMMQGEIGYSNKNPTEFCAI